MRQENTRTLVAHWNAIRGLRSAPDRNDIDPIEMGPLLQDVFILGIDTSGLWRYRVAGTRLSAYAARGLKDEPFSLWWRAADRIDSARIVAGVADEAVPMVGGLIGIADDGETHECEIVLLPLRHGGRTMTRLLGAIFPSAKLAVRHGVTFSEIGLVSLRTIMAADKERLDLSLLQSAPVVHDRRARLRVIQGGLVS
jgi:hypothetical protein